VDDYIAALTPERRAAVEAVRRVILDNLGRGYEEGIQYGMIGYYVPHSAYPAGYHADPEQPLPFLSLASQKNHLSLYLFCTYGGGEESFRKAWAATGKKLDMGKACVRFRKADDLALDVIGRTIKALPLKTYVAQYVERLGDRAKPATKKATAKTAQRKR
jgi:hypothetical protein